MAMPDLMLIGEFSARTRLSPKALRLYDEAGLLTPVRVDPANGYRWYDEQQVPTARVISMLRYLDMPVAQIALVLKLEGKDAADAVRSYWFGVTAALHARSAAVDQLTHLLEGAEPMSPTYVVETRSLAERSVLSAVRYVHEAESGGVMGELLGRMRQSAPGLSGIEGCPYMVFHGEVSADSDGPVEIVRPTADASAARAAAEALGDVQARVEKAHDEAFVRVTLAEAAWPAQLAVLEAVKAHVDANGREPAGHPRQVMVGDWRTAGVDDKVCEIAVPLS